jgi:hypothetical protein
VVVGSIPAPPVSVPPVTSPVPPVTAFVPPITTLVPHPAVLSLSARIKAALANVLAPSGQGATIRSILRSGYPFRVTLPAAGKLSIRWYTKVKRKQVLIASASATVRSGKKTTVKVKLTKAGKRLLKHAKKLKVTSKVSFTVKGSKPITATKTFTLR